MNTVVVVLLTLAGLLIGAAIAWLAGRGSASAAARRKAELEQELASVRSQLAVVQQENAELGAARAAAEATLESERSSTREKIDWIVSKVVGIGGGVQIPGDRLQYAIYIKRDLVACGLALVKNNCQVMPYAGRGLAIAIGGVSHVAL